MQCVSREEIIHAAGRGPILHRQGGVTVTRVHQDAVLKYGSNVHLSEARNMRLVLKCTNVRLPTVCDAWEGKANKQGIGYLLMEYIEGDALDKKWADLDIHVR